MMMVLDQGVGYLCGKERNVIGVFCRSTKRQYQSLSLWDKSTLLTIWVLLTQRGRFHAEKHFNFFVLSMVRVKQLVTIPSPTSIDKGTSHPEAHDLGIYYTCATQFYFDLQRSTNLCLPPRICAIELPMTFLSHRLGEIH